MQKTALKVVVGWGSQTETSVNLNFRMEVDEFEWFESIEYTLLCILSEAVEASQLIRDVYFPTIDDQLLHEMSLSKSPQKKSISPNYVQNMEVIRKSLEVWIATVFDHIAVLDDESKQWCKQLFFKSHDKLLVFDRLCGGGSVINSHKTSSTTPNPVVTPTNNKEIRDVPKNDPAHKDYNKSIFTKVTHKFQKLGKSRNHKAEADANSHHSHRAESDDDEPRLTVTDRESVFSYSQSDRPAVQSLSAPRVKPISIAGMFRTNRQKGAAAAAVDEAEDHTPSSVKVEVQRGEEHKPGVIVYDILIKVSSKKHPHPVVFSTFQRYNSFKLLHESLALISSSPAASGKDVSQLTQPFPKVTTSEAIFGLSDTALSERTRSLDVWFREVCMHYRSMSAQAKAAVREFLHFDMTKPKDIYVQDQLTWGVIEPLNAGGSSAAAAVVLVVPRSVADGSSVRDKASVSAASAAVAAGGGVVSGASVSGGGGGARGRQSLYAASDAGGALGGGGRMSMVGPPPRGGGDVSGAPLWETQSNATGRR